MSERRNLLSVSFHSDDDTGMYQVGEIDFGVNSNLDAYIKQYGYKAVNDILSVLGHLAWEVKDCYYKTKHNDKDQSEVGIVAIND